MQDNPMISHSSSGQVRCAGPGCTWIGRPAERITHPADAGRYMQRIVCPRCHGSEQHPHQLARETANAHD
jgi:hypothetical protein